MNFDNPLKLIDTVKR